MTTDHMDLLRDFRKDIPEPDAETMSRAYAHATGGRSRAERRLRLPLPATKRVRILGCATVAGTAALIGVFSFSGITQHRSVTRDGFTGGGPELIGGSTQNGLAFNSVPFSQAMNDASTSFGAPLILPNTSVLKASGAPSIANEEWCPPSTSSAPTLLCQVAVQFASPFLSITYAPTTMTYWGSRYPDARDQYQAEAAQARDPTAYQTISLSDGTPALLDVSKTGNLIEFRLGELSIEIWAPNNNDVPTAIDAAALQGLAQSILHQAAAANP